jgi:hypothetical protein
MGTIGTDCSGGCAPYKQSYSCSDPQNSSADELDCAEVFPFEIGSCLAKPDGFLGGLSKLFQKGIAAAK